MDLIDFIRKNSCSIVIYILLIIILLSIIANLSSLKFEFSLLSVSILFAFNFYFIFKIIQYYFNEISILQSKSYTYCPFENINLRQTDDYPPGSPTYCEGCFLYHGKKCKVVKEYDSKNPIKKQGP